MNITEKLDFSSKFIIAVFHLIQHKLFGSESNKMKNVYYTNSIYPDQIFFLKTKCIYSQADRGRHYH